MTATTGHARRWLAVAFVALLIAGCRSSGKVDVSVTALEGAFPTIVSLGLQSYELRAFTADQPECEAIRYGRGAFTTIAGSASCGLLTGESGTDAVPFDGTASADLAELKRVLSASAPSFRQIKIKLVGGAVGAGSWFKPDACRIYFYDPGWTRLPEPVPGKQTSSAVNSNWYLTDDCP